MAKQHIAVAVSGGGHRASLFALGALLYLADAGKGPELSTISSVSGGSITNAHLGVACDLTTASPTEVWAAGRTVGRRCASQGTLWASPLTYALLASIAAAVAGGFYLGAQTTGVWAVLAPMTGLLAAGVLAQCRSRVAAHAFAHTLFDRRTLEDFHGEVSHVLCAADLQTSESVYFSDRFVHSWRTGWQPAGALGLARAVQASACLPGAFNAVRIDDFLLTDGGVYDNMATEWPLRLGRRLQEGTPPTPAVHEVDEVVVVNASAGRGVTPRRTLRWPFVGEVTTLLAVKDVLYDQTTATRRRLLDLRYRIARAEVPVPIPDGPLSGTTIQIDRTPYELATSFADGDDDAAARATAVLAALGPDDEEGWKAIAQANRSVKTSLSRIGVARSAALVRHAYVLTMANCHVLLDYPLLPIPDEAAARKAVS